MIILLNLSDYYNRTVYDSEGNLVGQVFDVILNIKKGRISILKTRMMAEQAEREGFLGDLKNIMNGMSEENKTTRVLTESVIDIPYESILTVGDIIIIDKRVLEQYNATVKTKTRDIHRNMIQSNQKGEEKKSFSFKDFITGRDLF